MELHEKLQELRKQKGLTQKELAERLYVSRTAISKWETGRGYPNIDLLKQIAAFFDVSLDTLLSKEEMFTIAQTDSKKKLQRHCDVVYGLLDLLVLLFLFLPLFAQRSGRSALSVSLLALATENPAVKVWYLIAVGVIAAYGTLMLALQNYTARFWMRQKQNISLLLSACTAVLLILGSQPYAAVTIFSFLAVKAMTRFVSQM